PLLFAVCSLLLSSAPSRAGIPYFPDHVPAATLIVPFFEVGVDVNNSSNDTLLVVSNVVDANRIIHYHVWNRMGVPVFSGDVLLGSRGHWSASMRDLIRPLGSAKKDLLVIDTVYQGFVTIDLVTQGTSLNPTE